MVENHRKGKFIVLEGPEGSGKTTQAERLVNSLSTSGIRDVVQMREPGGTRIGEQVRTILLDPENKGMHPLTEFFLFLSSRVKFVQDIVKPKVNAGYIVIADRFALSTMAYQIHSRELPEEPCMNAINLAIQGYEPDLYVLLMVSPEEGRRRQKLQGKKADRFEQESLDFHHKVRDGYMKFGKRLSNCRAIDTEGFTEDEVHLEVLRYVREVIPEIGG